MIEALIGGVIGFYVVRGMRAQHAERKRSRFNQWADRFAERKRAERLARKAAR